MGTNRPSVCATLLAAMILAGGCDRGSQTAPPQDQPADGSEGAGRPDVAGHAETTNTVRVAYHAVLDAAAESQARVVADQGRAPWGLVAVLRHPDFDSRAARAFVNEYDMERDEFEAEVAVSRAAAAALREAGMLQNLAELTRAVGALDDDAAFELPGTHDRRARDAGRMLMCLAVDTEVAKNDGEAPAGEDDYITIIAGLDAMARAQFHATDSEAYWYNLSLLRMTDSLVIDAIAAGHVSQRRALALLNSARVATDELRERYLDKQPMTEWRETMANLWHVTRDGRRVALAIEVYRSHRGVPPMSLDGLAPDALAEKPRDPWAWNGEYKYRRDESNPFGYVLYSVGPDGINDWGVRDGLMPTPEPGTDQLLVPPG